MPRRKPAPDLVVTVGRRIAELRGATGVTQEKLAEKLKVSLKYLQRVEAGKENLTLRSLERFAELLGADPRDLLIEPAPENRAPKTGRPKAKIDSPKHQ